MRIFNLVFSSRGELLNLVRETFLVWSLKTSVGWVSQGLLGITQGLNLKHRNVSNLMISWLISGISVLSCVQENWIPTMPFQIDESWVWDKRFLPKSSS